MRRDHLNPPAIEAPAPRQPSFGAAAAKARAATPGCQNPHRRSLWAFAGSTLNVLEVPKVRYRSAEEEAAALAASEEGPPEAPVPKV